MATDMCHHVSNIERINSIIPSVNLRNDQTLSAQHIQILLQSALHVSDLSNPSRPLAIALRWTDKITEEFFSQGDSEKEMGLKVSLMMDRTVSLLCL
jgi:hypothetical protein